MRRKRIWYEGATYHIVTRGNKRENIFLDEGDFQYFEALLNFTKQKYTFHVYAYCMMTNHYHLQISTGKQPIWQIMAYINMSYSRYYNKKYNKCGHVFEKRYSSMLIETDNYMMETSRYIHLNPVRARMVNKAIKYPWSSYKEYVTEYIKSKSIVCTQPILDYFEESKREEYQKYVESTTQFSNEYKQIAKEMEGA